MHMAAQFGHAAVIRALLKAGASATYIAVKDAAMRQTPASPLHLACRFGQVEAVDELLKAPGADPSAADDHGWTSLMRAAGNGHVELVRLLLDAKAAIDAQDEKGKTALFAAAMSGQQGTASMLLARGAKPDLHDTDGLAPLLAASAHGHEATVQLLLREKADVNHCAPWRPGGVDASRHGLGQHVWSTALIAAASSGFDNVVRYLLQADAEPDQCRESDGKSALMLATEAGHCAVARCLVQKKADVHLTNRNGESALMMAKGGSERAQAVLPILLKDRTNVFQSNQHTRRIRGPCHLLPSLGESASS